MSDEKKLPDEAREAEPQDQSKAMPAMRDAARRGPAIITMAESYVDRKVAEAEAKKYAAEGELYRAKVDTAQAWEELKKQERRHQKLDTILDRVENDIVTENTLSEIKRRQAETELANLNNYEKTRRAKQGAERAEALLAQKEAMRALRGNTSTEKQSVEEKLDELHAKRHELIKEKDKLEEEGQLDEVMEASINKRLAMLIRQIENLEGDL